MMEADVIVSVAAAVVTLSVGALIWTLNRLWERMEKQDAKFVGKIDALEARMNAKFDDLNGKTERMLTMMSALANHRRDQDGDVVFSLPPGA